MKDFKEPVKFTHLVAPGLEHQMPTEWQAKAEAEYRKYTGQGRDPEPERVRFVTYTPRYGSCHWVAVFALEQTYEKAVVEGTRKGPAINIRTQNVRRLFVVGEFQQKVPSTMTVDGQQFEVGAESPVLRRSTRSVGSGRTSGCPRSTRESSPASRESGRQGPIDDAYMDRFVVAGPSSAGWNDSISKCLAVELTQFGKLWDKYFRGSLPTIKSADYDPKQPGQPRPLRRPAEQSAHRQGAAETADHLDEGQARRQRRRVRSEDARSGADLPEPVDR